MRWPFKREDEPTPATTRVEFVYSGVADSAEAAEAYVVERVENASAVRVSNGEALRADGERRVLSVTVAEIEHDEDDPDTGRYRVRVLIEAAAGDYALSYHLVTGFGRFHYEGSMPPDGD